MGVSRWSVGQEVGGEVLGGTAKGLTCPKIKQLNQLAAPGSGSVS